MNYKDEYLRLDIMNSKNLRDDETLSHQQTLGTETFTTYLVIHSCTISSFNKAGGNALAAMKLTL